MAEKPDVVILAGGAGLRLKSVIGETPKPMARIGDRPFLELLLRQLRRYDFSRAILSVGQKQQVIREHFGDTAFGLKLCYSNEPFPLGTGGGLCKAVEHITTDYFLASNGDSYTDIDLDRLLAAHLSSKADVTMAVISDTRSDAGSVVLDKEGRVTAFAEKRNAGSPYRSAGIYALSRNLVAQIPPDMNISLEEKLFPAWLNIGKVIRAFVSSAQCIDIGTPERYQEAQSLLGSVELGEPSVKGDSQL